MKLLSNRLRSTPLLAAVLFLSSMASALAMDMSMGDSASHAHPAISVTSSNTTDLEPIAHEPKHMHGVPILETDLTSRERAFWENYNTTTYLTMESAYQSYAYTHLALLVLVLFGLYPISLILNNIGSKWYLPVLTFNNGVLTVSLFSYMIFVNNVEDLYPGNVYGKMGVILFFLALTHYLSAVIKAASQYMAGSSDDPLRGMKSSYIPMTEYHASGSESPASTLFDHNRNSSSRPNSASFDLDADAVSLTEELPNEMSRSTASMVRDNILGKLLTNQYVLKVVSGFDVMARIWFSLTNYFYLCYLFTYFITGVSVLNCLGKGATVFNLLAHFIKGGVFFSLGVLSLTRYLGAFEKAGLGWNYSFIGKFEHLESPYLRKQPVTSMLTMEMIESSLILFYGCTNIFLEHLAAAGEAWTAKDLQHVSIAFMFIGCGLCGVLTELRLSSWRRERFMSSLRSIESITAVSKIEAEAILTCTPGFSPNPFPAFTIFFTGLLMSAHEQASALSTTIHVQWGTLLTYGSCVRLFTILVLLFWKHNSYESLFKPVRPFTELITSFCLLAGGLIFMQSTDPIVLAMEYRGFTAMFTLNVNIGVVTLLMGWIMLLFSWKDHLKSKQLA